MDTTTLSPDGFPLPADDPQIESHQLLSAFMEQTLHLPYARDAKAQDYPSGVKILAQTGSNNVVMGLAAFRRMEWLLIPSDGFWKSWYESPKRRHLDSMQVILTALFRRKLPLTEDDVRQILQAVISLFQLDRDKPRSGVLRHWLPLSGLVKNLEWHAETAEISQREQELLQSFRQVLQHGTYPEKEVEKLIARVDVLLGVSFNYEPEPGEAWADKASADLKAIPPEKHLAWKELFAHAATADSAKPSEKWLSESAKHRGKIGEEEFARLVGLWLNLVAAPPALSLNAPKEPFAADLLDNPRAYDEFLRAKQEYKLAEQEYLSRISEKNNSLLKGLAWYSASSEQPDVARGLAKMTQAAFTNIVGYGPMATRAGNAGIWALGQMPGGTGVGALATLRTRLRDRGALKLIAATIESAAKASGMTVDELEDLAVPTGGLDMEGARTETFGAEGSARLTLDSATGRTKLEWFGADGKPRRVVPAGVKRGFAAEVKALKAAEEEVASALSAQAARFDKALLDERVWTLGVWRERYGSHPVLGNLARRLLWTVNGVAALPVGDGFVNVSGQTLAGLTDEAEVKLWHPISAPPEEVMRWRDALETRGLTQPFKQAHREVYLLTDAERATRSYSNRFAAHILKQHQFNSLCVLRGWKNTLRLMVDDVYPPATRRLPQYGLRAEFWVEGIGDDYQVDTNEAGTYLRLATDQVRFYAENAETNYAHAGGGGYASGRGQAPAEPLPLAEVPPLALSEVMRDVDLFVGVASLGNDPAWSDGGPAGRFRNYWQDYAFGDLGETAKTRAEVLGKLLPRLKIAARCALDGKFLTVRGDLRTYKIHLGSGNILMEPNDQYLCIVPGRSEETGDLFLPFEGDRMLAIILSKAFLLADDTGIKDPTIVSQIKR